MRLSDQAPQKVTNTVHITMLRGGDGGGVVCQHQTLGGVVVVWCINFEHVVGVVVV